MIYASFFSETLKSINSFSFAGDPESAPVRALRLCYANNRHRWEGSNVEACDVLVNVAMQNSRSVNV